MVLVYLLLLVLTLVVILSVVVFVKYFCDSETVMCESTEKMHGKTVVITGASSGIGKEAARELAKRGAKVIMACRNIEKAETVKNEIVECSGNENVHVSKLDLSSFKSIREFADNLIETEDKIDVLIHNAGTAEMRYHLTEDGLERTMATNHFGPFNLTLRLIKLMKASAPSRIVIVASDLYRLASLDTDDLSVDRIRIPAYIYYVSKYCNMIYTMELARRLKGTGVTANCLHPGMIDSGIWRNVPAPLSWPLKLICKVFFKTPVQGAQTIIYLATSEDVKDVSGQYFIDCKEQPVDPVLKDTLRGRQLWQNSLLSVDLRLRDIRI